MINNFELIRRLPGFGNSNCFQYLYKHSRRPLYVIFDMYSVSSSEVLPLSEMLNLWDLQMKFVLVEKVSIHETSN
jgi:hypothetical protein